LAAHQGALAVHDLGPEELTGATMALASAVLRTMERAMRTAKSWSEPPGRNIMRRERARIREHH
jgi:hypothetical protein